MGLPSLLEDIVQKRIDAFLQAELSSAQIYTREDFKRVLSHMGVSARNLLSVSDDELVEISEFFARDAEECRLTAARLAKENQDLRAANDRAEADISSLRSKVFEAHKKAKTLEKDLAKRSSDLLKRNQEIKVLKAEVGQLKSMVEGLRALSKLVDRK
ncbi:hypothetical protein CHX26_07790 [Porphyrobacter sp. HT-58-2]|uniref:hypothetical protein n=1 Tax=Porphyrobacter sp. HT-58-2 TaxID=2023229 RepID=UPI000CDC41DA|nr:hypothetical protein [Porphyrobacter sp. HT-58-2]AUX69407.1 hypothetical protein CHX26_07790 [Porphyrobacter sp. HT-58-2]